MTREPWTSRLRRLDARCGHALSRLLGMLLLALFIAFLCALLYLWFRHMDPYG